LPMAVVYLGGSMAASHGCCLFRRKRGSFPWQLSMAVVDLVGKYCCLALTCRLCVSTGTEWVDPEDPTVIAENELLGAAAAIEAAARKLELLRPRTKPKEADESLNFEEQILEAAKSIAAATSALVKAASAAQRELVAQGKVGACPANAVDDGQWSQGLISAVSVTVIP
ncbi:unnamed protein product, partial [Oncorhynchus mykiss]